MIDLADALGRLDPKDPAIVGLRFVGGFESASRDPGDASRRAQGDRGLDQDRTMSERLHHGTGLGVQLSIGVMLQVLQTGPS